MSTFTNVHIESSLFFIKGLFIWVVLSTCTDISEASSPNIMQNFGNPGQAVQDFAYHYEITF